MGLHINFPKLIKRTIGTTVISLCMGRWNWTLSTVAVISSSYTVFTSVLAPLLPLRHGEVGAEECTFKRRHNGSLSRKMKRILVPAIEIWCRTAIVSSGQMGRVHDGTVSFPTSKTGLIFVLHTFLAFNAVTEKKRLIKSMAFVSCDANEVAAWSRSHLQSMTGFSALNLITKHPLGLYYFHPRHSSLRLPSFLF